MRLTPSLIVVLLLAVIVVLLAFSVVALVTHILAGKAPAEREATAVPSKGLIVLPMPRIRHDVMSVEEAIAYRRSIREYTNEPVTLEQLSQLLWTAYGITEPHRGFHAAPSAGATYPLEIYVVVGERGVRANDGFLEPGSYKYDPHSHTLRLVKRGDLRRELCRAALDQEWVCEAPLSIVICAVYERTTSYYGQRGYRYVYMEVGHVGQNIYLEATALGLGTVAVGAFYDEDVRRIIGAKPNEHPLYIMPVGVPVKPYRVSEEELWEYIKRFRVNMTVEKS